MKQRFQWLLAVVLLATGAALPRYAPAEEIVRIAAVVNDDVISMSDFLNRLRMVIILSKLPRTVEVQQRLAPEVMRTLIDEKLKQQEAKRLNLKVTEGELNKAMAQLEIDNNMPAGGLIESLVRQGIAPSSLTQQVVAALAWNKVLDQRVRPTIRISGEEVQETMDRLRRNRDQPRYLYSEIYLGVDAPDQEVSIRELAERLVQQISNGADFARMAKQFSHAGTAAVGGDAGWIQKGESDPEIDAALGTMKRGQILGPIRTARGYHVLMLRDLQIVEPSKPEDVTVSIAQVVLGYSPDAGTEVRDSQMKLAKTLSETAVGCSEMRRLGEEIGAGAATVLDDVKVGDLVADLRPLAVSLEIGKPSRPVDIKSGIAVVMVCKRADTSNLPKPELIRARIGQRRLSLLTRRYLRDLRRAAFLDVRV